jgi:DNA-binding NarL/FixJ family response regulator
VSGSIRVMVVDDQALVREGLMTLLDAAPDITPVVAAADGEEAVELCARHRPDVVLMDLRMPRLDGVEATRRIRATQPETEIVVLTTHADEESILDALRAGARGYLTKAAGITEIARAVHAAADRQVLLDPVVHLFAKIRVRDRAQAVHYAYTHDLAS